MTSPTPNKYNRPQTSNSLGQLSSTSRRDLGTHLEHDEEKMKFSVPDTASKSFLLNYIKSKFSTPPEILRLRGGVGGYPNSGFPNRVTIIVNIPPIGAIQNQQEGDARGLNLGLFKQGTDLIKSVHEEKALMKDAYGTTKEMFHDGMPKLDGTTFNQGIHLVGNVKDQRKEIHNIVGNAKEISDSLGIDIKGNPREAIEKMKKGYEAYEAVKKLKSEPFSVGNLMATGGSLFHSLGVGSRSAHISDLPLQSVGNTCPPCPNRRGLGGVRMRAGANIPETDVTDMDRPNFGQLKRLIQELNFKVDLEMEKCMREYKKYEENPNMSPEEIFALKTKIKCCKYKYSFIEGHISRLLANLK